MAWWSRKAPQIHYVQVPDSMSSLTLRDAYQEGYASGRRGDNTGPSRKMPRPGALVESEHFVDMVRATGWNDGWSDLRRDAELYRKVAPCAHDEAERRERFRKAMDDLAKSTPWPPPNAR